MLHHKNYQLPCAQKICLNDTLITKRVQTVHCGWYQVLAVYVLNPGRRWTGKPMDDRWRSLCFKKHKQLYIVSAFYFDPCVLLKRNANIGHHIPTVAMAAI